VQDRGPKDAAGRVKTGDSPWERCPCRKARMIPTSDFSDSSPASVEESAAAEQQHHEDDDEQRGRVHYSLPCVWRARPCVIAFT